LCFNRTPTIWNIKTVIISITGAKLTIGILNQISWPPDDLLLPYNFDLSNFHQINNPVLIEHIEKIGKVIYEKPDGKISEQ